MSATVRFEVRDPDLQAQRVVAAWKRARAARAQLERSARARAQINASLGASIRGR